MFFIKAIKEENKNIEFKFEILKIIEFKDNKNNSYKIIGDGKLGKGGGGYVYLCEDSNGNKFAIKVFSRIKKPYKENLARFKNEINFLINSNHPNVIKVITQGEFNYENYDHLPFYVMSKAKCNLRDYAEEIDLRNNDSEFKRILFEVIEGLIYIHDRGKRDPSEEENYHRDIKPENILIMEDNNRAVIADFGIAHLREEFQVEQVETDPQKRPKNLRYYAPEIISGDPVDKRCDIFSLGYVIYELLTGELPRGTGQKITDKNPKHGPLLNLIVDIMRRQNPAERFDSLQEVKTELMLYFDKNLKNLEIPIDKMSIEEKALFLNLLELDEDIANHFIGVISTLRSTSLPVRFYQSANSIHLICKFLNQLMEDYFKNVKILPERSEELRNRLFEQLSRLCSFFINIANGEKTNEREFEDSFREFNLIISEILKSNIKILQELDKLLKKEAPTENDINTLFELLSKPAHSQYFFTRLTSPKWFDLLFKNKLFEEPRTSIVEGSLMVSIWPQVNYLIAISKERPDDVFSIIKSLTNSKNFKIYWPLMECLYNMPLEISQKAISILKEWFSYFISIPMLAKMKELINKYIDEGENKGAFEILEILFSVDEPEIKLEYQNLHHKFFFIFSEYKDIQEKMKNFDLTKKLDKYLHILCNSLSNYLEKEMQSEIGDDLSEIWRSSIEIRSRNDIGNLFVDEIIDYLKYIAENDLELLKSKYDLLSNYKWIIFKRIQLNLLNSYSNIFMDEIEATLTDPEIFKNDKYWKEYSELIKNHFSLIPESAREMILSWIKNGPDYNKYGIIPERFTDDDKYQNYKEIFGKNWLIKKAKPIYESLPPELIELYAKIKLESREFKIPSRKKKLEPEEIRSLNNEELIKYLNENPNDRNLKYFLISLISENPSKNINLLFKFTQIPFFYLSSIVEGSTRALKGDKKFNINEYAQGIIQISKFLLSNEDLAEDIGFWRSFISFFGELLSLRNIQLEDDFLKDLWVIICALLEKKEPKIKTQDITFENYLQFSINTYTGAVLRLIIKYALYNASISDLPPQNRMIPDVKEKLEELLDPKNESAKIIWSIIAYNLYNIFYLDKNWATNKIPIIFSKEEQDLWLIAWESYISYSKLNSKIYLLLRNDYIKAIEKLGTPIFSYDSLKGLASHMALVYIFELEDLNGDSVVSLFISNAKSKTRSIMMWSAFRVYENYKDTNEKEKVLEKIINLWKYEIEFIKENSDLTKEEIYDEIHWYGMLFQKIDIQQKYLDLLKEVLILTEGNLGNTTNFIFEILNKYVEINPKDVLDVIGKLLKGELSSWLYEHNVKKIMEIIKLVNDKHNIQDFKGEVKSIIERLIEESYSEIRDLDFIKNI